MDLREYVVALSVVCRPSQTLDTIQLAFQASGMYVHMVHGDSEMWSHQSSGGFRGLCQICRAVTASLLICTGLCQPSFVNCPRSSQILLLQP
jgi:hypothetical protein